MIATAITTKKTKTTTIVVTIEADQLRNMTIGEAVEKVGLMALPYLKAAKELVGE